MKCSLLTPLLALPANIRLGSNNYPLSSLLRCQINYGLTITHYLAYYGAKSIMVEESFKIRLLNHTHNTSFSS